MADTDPPKPDTKKCPYCGKQVLVSANWCPHCGTGLFNQSKPYGTPASIYPIGPMWIAFFMLLFPLGAFGACTIVFNLDHQTSIGTALFVIALYGIPLSFLTGIILLGINLFSGKKPRR